MGFFLYDWYQCCRHLFHWYHVDLMFWHWRTRGCTPSLITLRSRQNGRHFADDILKCIFLNENVSIPITISLKIVPKGPINNIPALVQIMAWRRPGGKPLSEPMMVSLLTHICVTQPQWVNSWRTGFFIYQIKINDIYICNLFSLVVELPLYGNKGRPMLWHWINVDGLTGWNGSVSPAHWYEYV